MRALSLSLALVACVACVACGGAGKQTQAPKLGSASTTRPPQRGVGRSWSGTLACTYKAGHGWGNIFECAVTVVDGEAPDTIRLQLSVSDTALQGLDEDSLGEHVFRFRPSKRPYGPPSGYSDPTTKVYWTVSVED